MKIANFKIKKIIKEEIERALFENQNESDLILDLGRESVEIVNNLGYAVIDTGELDSRYLDFFQEVLEAAVESAERYGENEDGQYESLEVATQFYSRNINRFPSDIRSSVSSLVERFDELNNSRQPALASIEDDETFADTESLA